MNRISFRPLLSVQPGAPRKRTAAVSGYASGAVSRRILKRATRRVLLGALISAPLLGAACARLEGKPLSEVLANADQEQTASPSVMSSGATSSSPAPGAGDAMGMMASAGGSGPSMPVSTNGGSGGASVLNAPDKAAGGDAPMNTGAPGEPEPTVDGQGGDMPVAVPAVCEGGFPAPSGDAAQHSLSVDATSSWGQLPHFWNTFGTGHLGLLLREDKGWGETLKAHLQDGVENLGLTRVRQHGLFHDDIGIYHEEDGVPVYDFTRSDQIFDFLVGLGIQPIVEMAPMPSDLAADPSLTVFDWQMIVSQPKDYELWQELVYQFVAHSIERYGTDEVSNWYFEVWNEPECCSNKFWAGNLDEYFELYDHTAAGVRRALPEGRVGGPVASQPLELTSNSALGINFLEHITTDNYVNPGTPGVLDFFAYHSWSFIDGSVGGYFQGLDLLDQYGFNDVQIAITEFGPTWEFGLDNEPQEMDQGAAFVAQTYSDISVRAARDGTRFPIAYSWWVLSDIFEEEEGVYRSDEPFIGCMGLTSRENIRKPAYNVYKFLAEMGNEQLASSVNTTGGVGGMAARSEDGGIQVLLYNGQSPGAGPGDGNYYAVTEAQQVELSISGLDPELPYDVTLYRVDDTHGNAYAVWESQGRPAMADMTDDDWGALQSSMDSPAEPLGQNACGDSFTYSVPLPSPGVLFMTLTPSQG